VGFEPTIPGFRASEDSTLLRPLGYRERPLELAMVQYLLNTLVRIRVWSSGIRGGQSGAGAGFLRVLLFLLPIFIPPNSPGTIGQ
jgi:hypothetical protein